MGWLENHIKDFVKPTVGGFDETPLGYFIAPELSVIKNTWRSVKKSAKGRPVFLAGRDVFIFEILAQREKYPTIFMPECSRQTVHRIGADNPVIKDWFLFDTGFMGSIPKNLGIQDFTLLSHIERDSVKIQVFPKLSFSRGLALKIEKTPKYWESGRVLDGAIKQDLSKREEFINAARLTIEIYKNSAPKFIPQHQPIGKEAFQ